MIERKDACFSIQKKSKERKKNSRESSISDDDENKIPVYQGFVCFVLKKRVIRNYVVGFSMCYPIVTKKPHSIGVVCCSIYTSQQVCLGWKRGEMMIMTMRK